MTTETKRAKEAMGQVRVTLELANFNDEENARLGVVMESQVRRASVEALVDTGATQLVLPKTVADQLGLRVLGRVPVRYANEQKAVRDLVGVVTVTLMGRKTRVDAIVEPDKTYALLGQIPLEALDFHVDPKGQRLIPNPDSPDAPLSEMQ
mgnify:CR=1 FL=1